ncbi:MAG: FAD-dependent oxidoreductase [Pseudomonadota bacterium]
MQFVVIGADAAGMSAASRAKRRSPDMAVTVFERSQDVSYSACGMPYNIAEPHRDMNDLVVRTAEAFRAKQGIDLLTGHTVTRIDPGRRIVQGTRVDGSVFSAEYDRLLIATGASPVRPALTGIDLPEVMVLKSLADGRAIKNALARGTVRRVAILGMGYIALEMCEALAARGIAVVMVKPGPDLLPWMDRQLADAVRQELETHGVGLHAGTVLTAIRREGDALRLDTEQGAIDADLVIAAVGVAPNSALAADAGLALGPSGAIAVGEDLMTSDPAIYAAGDCADAFHVVTGQRVWIPLALRANRAGWAVADTVSGELTRLEGVAGTAVFKVFDLEVARTGLTAAEAAGAGFDSATATITTRSRAHAHPGAVDIHVHIVGDRGTGRILGAQIVGKEGAAHRINAAAVALHAKMTVAAFAQSDLAYAPPFGPVWDPLLVAANQLMKKL